MQGCIRKEGSGSQWEGRAAGSGIALLVFSGDPHRRSNPILELGNATARYRALEIHKSHLVVAEIQLVLAA